MSTASIPIVPAASAKGLARLRPSLSDTFFVLMLAISFMVHPSAWESLLRDGDTGFHIRVGDWIRASGALPHEHPFAFAVKKEWFAFEWLSQIIMSLVHSAAGLKSIVLGGAVLTVGVFTLLFRFTLWSGANGLAALAVLLVAFNVNLIHALSRPHLFTWLFLVAGLWIFEHDRRTPGPRVYLLLPLCALWANLHGGFALFLVLLGLHAAVLLAEAIFEPGPQKTRKALRAALLTTLCAAATLVNPYTYRLHLHILEFMRSEWIMDLLDEFKSPVFREAPAILFLVLMFASLGSMASLLRKRRRTEAVWILFLSYASLVSVRHMTVFTLAVSPILALVLTEAWRDLAIRSSRKSTARILFETGESFGAGGRRSTLWPVAFVCWLWISSFPAWPRDFPKSSFPVELAHRQAQTLAGKRVLTSDQWSDYLIYLNFPNQSSFIDPQTQYYGKQHALEYIAMIQATPRWSEIFARYGFDYVLVDEGAPLVTVLPSLPGWKQIDQAGDAVLFARTP